MNLNDHRVHSKNLAPQERLNVLATTENSWRSLQSRVQALGDYNASTRDEYKSLAGLVAEQCRDWRSAAVGDCAKAELPTKLRLVTERTLSGIGELRGQLNALHAAELDREARRAEASSYRSLARRVQPFKNVYVGDFDDPTEGLEAWDCLIHLVETGFITEEQLPGYGINLPA